MLPRHLRVLYLHGFASSPASRKAQFFLRKLAERGMTVEIPDLAEGHFEALTISGQLRVLERGVRREPVVLIGSSLGGYLAALYAAQHVEVSKLVLMAPAFNFLQLWTDQLGPERVSHWKESGSLSVFHYGVGREMPIGYQLLEDARNHPAYPSFHQPALICHGEEDPVVPIRSSLEYCRTHPNARLLPFPSGHELTDVMEAMWQETCSFLEQ